MADTQKLREEWEQAEAHAIALQNEKDAAIDAVRAKYTDQCRDATNDAAAKQKLYLDADAGDALRDRPDGESVARALGLSLD